jgi:hypothetical protein
MLDLKLDVIGENREVQLGNSSSSSLQSRLSPLRLQLFWDLAISYKGLALQEKITVQEAVLKS